MGDKIAALQFAKSLGLKTINGAVLNNNIESFISNCESLNFSNHTQIIRRGGGEESELLVTRANLVNQSKI